MGRSSHYCQVLLMGVPNMLLCSLRGGFWKPLEKWKAVPPCPALQDICQVGFGDSPMSLFGQLSLTGVTGYPSAIKSFCGSRVEATPCPWPVLWVGTLAPSPNTVRWRCSHNISRRWALRFAPLRFCPLLPDVCRAQLWAWMCVAVGFFSRMELGLTSQRKVGR